MGDLSEHFSRYELQCRCGCGYYRHNQTLIDVLEDVREHFGRPVKINSGCRCYAHNATIGGVKNSQHIHGTAADIKVDGVEPLKVWGYLVKKYPDRYGIGQYDTFTHLDVRPGKGRWS